LINFLKSETALVCTYMEFGVAVDFTPLLLQYFLPTTFK